MKGREEQDSEQPNDDEVLDDLEGGAAEVAGAADQEVTGAGGRMGDGAGRSAMMGSSVRARVAEEPHVLQAGGGSPQRVGLWSGTFVAGSAATPSSSHQPWDERPGQDNVDSPSSSTVTIGIVRSSFNQPQEQLPHAN